jgi:hypothetical protein
VPLELLALLLAGLPELLEDDVTPLLLPGPTPLLLLLALAPASPAGVSTLPWAHPPAVTPA